MNRREFIILVTSFYLTLFSKAASTRPLASQFNMKLSEFRVNAISAKEAFAELSKKVKEEDPEKKGLLIIFKATKDKKVSLNINAMPVIQIIKYLCLSGDYRYKITGRTVNITDK